MLITAQKRKEKRKHEETTDNNKVMFAFLFS